MKAAFRTVSENADYRVIEGLAIPYGGPFSGNSDDYGSRATPKTVMAWDLFPDRLPTDPPDVPARYVRPVMYNHGKDKTIGPARLGGWSPMRIDKWGVWAQAQISKREAWSGAIMDLLDHGALSFSSQALETTARFAANGDWLEWDPAELTVTPTPSNPWAGVTARMSELEQLFSITTNEQPSRCAACDVSLATDVQGMLAELMGAEQGEDDQVAMLKTAFDAVGQFIAAEAEEIGTDGDDGEADDGSPMAYMSSHLAHRIGKRNNGDDQAGIDAMHDLTVKLGASAHAGDTPPNDDTHQEPEPEPSETQPPDNRSARPNRSQTAALPDRIRILGLPGD